MKINKKILKLLWSLNLNDNDTLFNIKNPSKQCNECNGSGISQDNLYCNCLTKSAEFPIEFGDFKKIVKKVEKTIDF